MTDMKEHPFELSVSEDDLRSLRRKLEGVRFPDELASAEWAYGVPLADIKRLVMHWRDYFSWSQHEAEINKLPMYTRDIDIDGFGTLNIHYVHQRSSVIDAVPLLFVHGCES